MGSSSAASSIRSYWKPKARIGDQSVGFAWAQRACGFISPFDLTNAAAAIRPRVGVTERSSSVVRHAFEELTDSMQAVGPFLVVLAF